MRAQPFLLIQLLTKEIFSVVEFAYLKIKYGKTKFTCSSYLGITFLFGIVL